MLNIFLNFADVYFNQLFTETTTFFIILIWHK